MPPKKGAKKTQNKSKFLPIDPQPTIKSKSKNATKTTQSNNSSKIDPIIVRPRLEEIFAGFEENHLSQNIENVLRELLKVCGEIADQKILILHEFLTEKLNIVLSAAEKAIVAETTSNKAAILLSQFYEDCDEATLSRFPNTDVLNIIFEKILFIELSAENFAYFSNLLNLYTLIHINFGSDSSSKRLFEILFEKMKFLKEFKFIFQSIKAINSCLDTTKIELCNDKKYRIQIYDDLLMMLCTVGDQECQLALVELLHRIFNASWLLETSQNHKSQFISPQLGLKLAQINATDFESDCRNFLLKFNENLPENSKVNSIPCIEVCAGGKNGTQKYQKPVDENYDSFWIDFNTKSERITIFCNDIVSQGVEDGLWQTISLCKKDLSYFSLCRKIVKSNAYGNSECCQATMVLNRPVLNFIDFGPVVQGFEIYISFDVKYALDVEKILTQIFGVSMQRNKISEPSKSILVDGDDISNCGLFDNKSAALEKNDKKSNSSLKSKVSACLNPIRLPDYEVPEIQAIEDHTFIIEESPSVSAKISIEAKSQNIITDSESVQKEVVQVEPEKNAAKIRDSISKQIKSNTSTSNAIKDNVNPNFDSLLDPPSNVEKKVSRNVEGIESNKIDEITISEQKKTNKVNRPISRKQPSKSSIKETHNKKPKLPTKHLKTPDIQREKSKSMTKAEILLQNWQKVRCDRSKKPNLNKKNMLSAKKILPYTYSPIHLCEKFNIPIISPSLSRKKTPRLNCSMKSDNDSLSFRSAEKMTPYKRAAIKNVAKKKATAKKLTEKKIRVQKKDIKHASPGRLNTESKKTFKISDPKASSLLLTPESLNDIKFDAPEETFATPKVTNTFPKNSKNAKRFIDDHDKQEILTINHTPTSTNKNPEENCVLNTLSPDFENLYENCDPQQSDRCDFDKNLDSQNALDEPAIDYNATSNTCQGSDTGMAKKDKFEKTFTAAHQAEIPQNIDSPIKINKKSENSDRKDQQDNLSPNFKTKKNISDGLNKKFSPKPANSKSLGKFKNNELSRISYAKDNESEISSFSNSQDDLCTKKNNCSFKYDTPKIQNHSQSHFSTKLNDKTEDNDIVESFAQFCSSIMDKSESVAIKTPKIPASKLSTNVSKIKTKKMRVFDTPKQFKSLNSSPKKNIVNNPSEVLMVIKKLINCSDSLRTEIKTENEYLDSKISKMEENIAILNGSILHISKGLNKLKQAKRYNSTKIIELANNNKQLVESLQLKLSLDSEE